MTTHKPIENHGDKTTVHSPKAPGEVEKVNPQTGGTHTEHAGVKPAKN